jgi:putative peptidoglycan lipid II flippase
VSDPVRSPEREEVARPADLVSLATFSSRIAGLVRESLFAALFGIHPAADAFVVAFRIPNLFRDLFAEGALSSAFVPTYARVRAERGPEAGFALARTVLGTLLAITGTLALLGILFARPVVDLIAFGADEERRALAVPLTRIMFPFLPTVAVAAVWMGVLNSHGRYLVPAFAPVAFNLASIAGRAPAAARVGRRGGGRRWAVRAAGGLRRPMPGAGGVEGRVVAGHGRSVPRSRPRTIVWRMAPIAVALAGTQVMIVVTTGVATAHAGWVSAFQLRLRLIHLPIGLVGWRSGPSRWPPPPAARPPATPRASTM